MSNVINASWHKRHPMPRNPTVEERIAWHIEHQEECACRPIPPKLLEQIRLRPTLPEGRVKATKAGAGRRRRSHRD